MKGLVLGDLGRKVNTSAVITVSLILILPVLLATHIPCMGYPLVWDRRGMGGVRIQECKDFIKLWDECCLWDNTSIFPTPYLSVPC